MNPKPPQEFYAQRTMRENVAGIMKTFHETGYIGQLRPKTENQAKHIARAIAKSTRRRAKDR